LKLNGVTRTGLDTGVFVRLAAEDPVAVGLWDEAAAGKREGVVSALTLLEIDRLGLRGALSSSFASEALRTIPEVCEVVWIGSPELLRTAAKLGQGHALSLVDSLILASLLARDCSEIYTTDSDLARYRRKGLQVVRLASP
jgi:predicted nucleic acid-binding protein